MTPDEDDELAAWLRLLLTPGLGRVGARKLLAAFGTPQEVFTADATAHRDCVGPSAAEALGRQPAELDAAFKQLQAWLHEDANRAWVTLGDSRYPQLLLQSPDPPLLLYAQGRCELMNTRCLAVVGSRNPTAQGSDNARAFSEHLGRAGLTIMSGLALGIDGAAHTGALAAGAPTIAVVGTGLDRVYPKRHRELAHQIAESGLIISEFELGTPPLAPNFPQRNRIIAGMSVGTLVVEAALESGSLITARLAVEAGREVFAIPGSIHSPQSRGCHLLIKQGAKLVDEAQDVLEELGPLVFPAIGLPSASAAVDKGVLDEPIQNEPGDSLLAAMGYEPVGLDQLQARSGWPTARLSARLLELELEGHIARLPGGRYQRCARG